MTTETTEQLPLIPERLPTLGALEDIALDRFPPNEVLDGPPPTPALIESIRRWGVLEPVLVRAVGGALDYANPALLISGRRRLKAVRLLRDEYREKVRALSAAHPDVILNEETVPGYRAVYERMRDFQRVPARVVSDPEGLLTDGRTEALLVTANAVRQDNPQADFKALAVLLDRYAREGLPEAECLRRVAAATGLPAGTVKQRLRLLALSAELQDDFLAGRLGYTVALHASRLGPDAQEALSEKLDAGERATLDLVKAAKREAVQAVQASLLDDLPGEGETEPYAPPPVGSLADRAGAMLEQLRAIKMPIFQEAADVFSDLLSGYIDADASHAVLEREVLNGTLVYTDGRFAKPPVINADPPALPEDAPAAPPKRTRRKKVTE